MKSWSIHLKIFLGFLVLAAFSASFLFGSYPFLEKIRILNDSIVPDIQRIRTLKEKLRSLDDIEPMIDIYLILPSRSNYSKVKNKIGSILEGVHEQVHLFQYPQADKIHDTFLELEKNIFVLLEHAGNRKEFSKFLNQDILAVQSGIEESGVLLQQILGFFIDGVREKINQQNMIIDSMRKRFLVIELFIVIASFLLSILFSNVIVAKLIELNFATQKIAEGEFDFPIKVKSDDEIGMLARSFKVMRGKIKELLEQQKEYSQNLEAQVDGRTKELVRNERALKNLLYDINRKSEALKEANRIINMSTSVALRWELSEKWPVTFVTENVDKLTGFEVHEFLSRKVFYEEIIYEEDLARVTQEYERASEDKTCLSFMHEPYRIKTKQGDLKWVEDRTTIERDEVGGITSLQGMVVDVSERMKAKMELEQMQRQLLESEKMAAIGQLSAGVAHEVKNPLAIVSLAIDSLEDHIQQSSDEKVQRYVRMIKDATTRANNVIMDLMNFARYSELKMQDMHIIEALHASIELISNTAKIKSVEITENIKCPQDIMISGDKQLLEQVFLNLLGNAIDAVSEGGKIKVEAFVKADKEKGEEVFVIEMRDNGCGIPEDQLTEIFNPFFTTKEQGKGTGLGLSTVYTIIENHKGTITVKSKEGQETIFTITLPLPDQNIG